MNTHLNVTYKYECYSSVRNNVVFLRLQMKADPESEKNQQTEPMKSNSRMQKARTNKSF